MLMNYVSNRKVSKYHNDRDSKALKLTSIIVLMSKWCNKLYAFTGENESRSSKKDTFKY